MNENEILNEWRESRQQVDIPADFADRVVQGLTEPVEIDHQSRLQRALTRWVATGWGRALVCSMAAIVGLTPLAFLLLSLLFSPSVLGEPSAHPHSLICKQLCQNPKLPIGEKAGLRRPCRCSHLALVMFTVAAS